MDGVLKCTAVLYVQYVCNKVKMVTNGNGQEEELPIVDQYTCAVPWLRDFCSRIVMILFVFSRCT